MAAFTINIHSDMILTMVTVTYDWVQWIREFQTIIENSKKDTALSNLKESALNEAKLQVLKKLFWTPFQGSKV